MKLRNWFFATTTAAFLFSCNNKGEGNEYKDTTTTTTTDNTRTTSDYSVQVPEATRSSLTTKYPGATTVTWSTYNTTVLPIDWEWAGWTALDTSDYVATFNMDGSDYWVWYDNSGEWVGTVSPVTDFSTLPAAVTNTVNTKYKGYTIVSVDKENDKNRTAYEIELDNNGQKAKVLIAEDGTVLKSKGPEGKEKADTK